MSSRSRCMTKLLSYLLYVDDIMFFGKDPTSFFEDLTNKYNYKLKGVGKPVYHLGGDFFRNKDNTLLAWGTTSYVKKMLANYELMFNEKPKEASTPITYGWI